MGHVEFQIDQIKFIRLWFVVTLAVFAIPSLFRDDLKVLGIVLGIFAVGVFAFCTLAIRQGKQVLKHLEKHPEDADYWDDNPLS